MAEKISLDQIRDVLGDIDFPAGKDDVVRHAEAKGADDGVRAALRALPLARYDSLAEVLRSVDSVEATGQTPSEAGAQARAGSRPGLAEHQRTTRG